MELIMQINGRVLDSIKVHRPACDDESYLMWLKKELCIKHEYLLCQQKTEPMFFLKTTSFRQTWNSVNT
jgi:hypothetical protein